MIPDNDPQPWRVEQSEYIIQTPWVAVRQDAVRLPNGVILPDYYVFEYRDWVNVIAVTTDEQLVLVRQYRHGIRGVHYELCAGVVDPGEDPLDTARRELLEETGYGGGDWQPFMTMSANTGTHTNLNYTFLATGVTWQQPQTFEDTEDITVHVVSPQQAWALLDNGQLMQAICAAPLLKYLGRLNQPLAPEREL